MLILTRFNIFFFSFTLNKRLIIIKISKWYIRLEFTLSLELETFYKTNSKVRSFDRINFYLTDKVYISSRLNQFLSNVKLTLNQWILNIKETNYSIKKTISNPFPTGKNKLWRQKACFPHYCVDIYYLLKAKVLFCFNWSSFCMHCMQYAAGWVFSTSTFNNSMKRLFS